jgi:hypothetical protein
MNFSAQFDDHTAAPAPASGESGKFPSAFSLFQPSSQLVRKNLTNFVMVVLVPGIYFAVLEQFFNPKTADHHVAFWVTLVAIGLVYNLLVLAAKPVLELRTVQGQQFGLMEVIRLGWRYFWRLLGLYITVGAIITIGLLLLIVPGIIVIRRYALAAYFLIDQNVGIWEAMSRSAATTKGYSGAIWGLIGVQILLGAPGWIPVIGPLISAGMGMLYSCAPAMRYEQFKALNPRSAAKIAPQHQAPTNPVGD